MEGCMRIFNYVLCSVIVIFLFACAQPPKVDPGAMQITPADSEEVEIPKICEAQYQSKKFRVAVV